MLSTTGKPDVAKARGLEDRYGGWAAMMTLAFSERTRRSVLDDLAGSEDTGIRQMVAGNSKTPVGTLRRLAMDISMEVEGAAVLNLLRRGKLELPGRHDEM